MDSKSFSLPDFVTLCEDLHDGNLTSGKYKGVSLKMEPKPHVIIATNCDLKAKYYQKYIFFLELWN